MFTAMQHVGSCCVYRNTILCYKWFVYMYTVCVSHKKKKILISENDEITKSLTNEALPLHQFNYIIFCAVTDD